MATKWHRGLKAPPRKTAKEWRAWVSSEEPTGERASPEFHVYRMTDGTLVAYEKPLDPDNDTELVCVAYAPNQEAAVAKARRLVGQLF